MITIITIYIIDADINNNVLIVIIKCSCFLICSCFLVLANKIIPLSTYDKIARCIANDSSEPNNGFIVYLVDMLALTIIKYAIY